MKSVLISIQPKWCELIASGKKTIEVRKTRPKIETPFKCYIYETKEKAYEDIGICGRTKDGTRYNFVHRIGKVIGEFVCDKTDFFFAYYYDNGSADLTPSRLISGLGNANSELAYLNKCCLTHDQLFNYIISEKYGYGWHISDLKIYDKPKEMSEFTTTCRDAYCQDDYGTPTWFCKDGYGSCAVKDKEKEYPYNDECMYFDCPSVGGESCGYEDYAYCNCNGLKPITRPPQSWCYVDELEEML